MIRVTLLNRSRPRTVLLVHGLFTSSGYWLPYLASLKAYRLLILDIDYRQIGQSGQIDAYVQQVQEIIAQQAEGQVAAVISHSLGSLIASRLAPSCRQLSIEICPVRCATRRNLAQFIETIGGRIKAANAREQVVQQLQDADQAIARHAREVPAPASTIIYLPDADPFFSYHPDTDYVQFSGDHFEIAAAMDGIGTRIS